jgi:hypothetical protein
MAVQLVGPDFRVSTTALTLYHSIERVWRLLSDEGLLLISKSTYVVDSSLLAIPKGLRDSPPLYCGL